MVRTCCIPFCKTNADTNSKILLHAFPISRTMRSRWLDAIHEHLDFPIKRAKFVADQYAKVCSKHFLHSDYRIEGGERKLYITAVPSIFMNRIGNAAAQNEERNSKLQATKWTYSRVKHIFRSDKQCSSLEETQRTCNVEQHIKKNTAKLLTFVNIDHPYAALLQNELEENKSCISADDDDIHNDTTGTRLFAQCDTNIDVRAHETSPVIPEPAVELSKTSNESNMEVCNSTEIRESAMEPVRILNGSRTGICDNTKPRELTVKSVATLNENITKQIYINTETRENAMDIIDLDSPPIENDFIKDKVEELPESEDSSDVIFIESVEDDTVPPTNIAPMESPQVPQDQNHGMTDAFGEKALNQVHVVCRKGLPEICILCAAANMTQESYTLIGSFAGLIQDLSGVDIYQSNVPPLACNNCLRDIMKVFNLKNQIIASSKFISENIPKQLPAASSPGSVSNVTTFRVSNQGRTEVGNIDDLLQHVQKNKNSAAVIQSNQANKVDAISPPSLPKTPTSITVVPIDRILKKNSASVADNGGCDNNTLKRSENGLDLSSCADCGRRFTDINTRMCSCKLSVKSKNTRRKSYVCPACGKQCLNSHSLCMHKLVHQNPYPCPHCRKRFRSQDNLRDHKLYQHGNTLSQKC